MKHRYSRWMRISALLLTVALLVGCSSGNQDTTTSTVKPMEKETSPAISFNIIGGKDVMPIGGYYGPHQNNYCWDGNELPDLITDEMFEMYKDMGINSLTYSEINSNQESDAIIRILEMCEKYDMAYFPGNMDITYNRGDEVLTATQAGEQLAKWAKYDSWGGGFIVDEPSTSYFQSTHTDKYIEQFAEIADVLNNQLDIVSYGSLWPMMQMKNRELYEKYVTEWCETIHPKFLMWDEYPFEENYGGDMSVFITALSILSRNAKQYNIPLWFFVQAGDQFYSGGQKAKTPYWPNEAQFNWSINAGLAFGAQGISYYSLNEVAGSGVDENGAIDSYRSGLVGALGNKTMWYHYAKNINKHIAAIDHVLMNSVHKGVIVSGKEATSNAREASCILEGKTFQELQGVDGDAMVGCFNYNGKTALYVLNYSRDMAQYITLDFDAKHNVTITQAAETTYVKGQSITLDMAAGEGVLLVIE